MDCMYKGWAGGREVGWVVGEGGKPKSGYAFQQDYLE